MTAIVGALLAGTVATAGSADAATARNGKCETGEFCYYYNSNEAGSVSDFSSSVSDLGATQPSCYDFKGAGNGKGICVKNHAASVRNNTKVPVTVHFNSGNRGHGQTIAPGKSANLDSILKNQNAGHQFGSSSGGGHSGTVTGATATARAQTWVDAKVPYSMYRTRGGYRTDCSGYVSMAWGLPKPGSATPAMHNYGHTITKGQLKKGDALLNPSSGAHGHIVLFDKWANASHTSYWGYEEHGGGTHRADHRVIPYPYWSGYGTFTPFRYRGLA